MSDLERFMNTLNLENDPESFKKLLDYSNRELQRTYNINSMLKLSKMFSSVVENTKRDIGNLQESINEKIQFKNDMLQAEINMWNLLLVGRYVSIPIHRTGAGSAFCADNKGKSISVQSFYENDLKESIEGDNIKLCVKHIDIHVILKATNTSHGNIFIALRSFIENIENGTIKIL